MDELDIDALPVLDIDALPVIEETSSDELDIDALPVLDIDALPVIEETSSDELDIDALPVLDIDALPVIEDEKSLPNASKSQRAPWGFRNDGTPKDSGYFGVLKNANGDDVTEFSVGVNINGKEMDVPTLVPTLSEDEKRQVLDASAGKGELSDAIVRKAADFAKSRLAKGKSVWADKKDSFQTPIVSKDEAKAKGELGITETAQKDYEAATGADAPKNPILAQIANMGLTVGGRLNANVQMSAAQKLASGAIRDDREADELMDKMIYGAAKVAGDASSAVPSYAGPGSAMAMMFHKKQERGANEILKEWDEREGRRYTDAAERSAARKAFAQQIATDFIKERSAVQQNAEAELANRDVTHTANIVTRGLGQVGYTLPYVLGPVGIGLQFLEEGSANTIGYKNDKYAYDDDGNFVLASEGDDAGRAALAGFGTAGIETMTEIVGGKIGGAILKRAGKAGSAAAAKAAGALVGKTIGRFPVVKTAGAAVASAGEAAVEKLKPTAVGRSAQRFGNGLSNVFKWTSKKLHLENPLEENLEEYEGDLLNALTGFDRRASELVDPETGERTNPLGRFIDANKEFFSASHIIELNEAMLLTMGGGAFVAKCAQRKAAREVNNLIRKHNLMSEEELKDASLDKKAAALDAWAQGLSKEDIIKKFDKATSWVDKLADKIANESGKYAEEVNALREKMVAVDEYNTGKALAELKIPEQKFNFTTRKDRNGKDVPDFQRVKVTDVNSGETRECKAVYDESGIQITDNGSRRRNTPQAYSVFVPNQKAGRNFKSLKSAIAYATRAKNKLALDYARDGIKQNFIAKMVEKDYGGANIVSVKTAAEAVKESQRLGFDVTKSQGYDTSRAGWKLPDGTVILVRDNIDSPQKAETLLRHENIGHSEEMMKEPWLDASEKSQIGQLREANLAKAREEGTVSEAQEERIERESVANTVQERRHAPTIGDRVIHGVRQILKKAGLNLNENDVDMEVVAAGVEKAMRKGTDGSFVSEKAIPLNELVEIVAAAKKTKNEKRAKKPQAENVEQTTAQNATAQTAAQNASAQGANATQAEAEAQAAAQETAQNAASEAAMQNINTAAADAVAEQTPKAKEASNEAGTVANEESAESKSRATQQGAQRKEVESGAAAEGVVNTATEAKDAPQQEEQTRQNAPVGVPNEAGATAPTEAAKPAEGKKVATTQAETTAEAAMPTAEKPATNPSVEKSASDDGYTAWLKKYRLKDTPSHRKEWQAKQTDKVAKETTKTAAAQSATPNMEQETVEAVAKATAPKATTKTNAPNTTSKVDAKKAAAVVKEFTANKKDRAELAEVHHDHEKKVVVATDGSMLIVTKHGFDPKVNTYVPPYENFLRKVLEDKRFTPHKIDVDKLLNICKKAISLDGKAGRSFGNSSVWVDLGGTERLLDSRRLLTTLRAMKINGLNEIYARPNINSAKDVIFARNDDTTIFVMPLHVNDEDILPPSYKHNVVRFKGAPLSFDGGTGRIVSAPLRESNPSTRQSALDDKVDALIEETNARLENVRKEESDKAAKEREEHNKKHPPFPKVVAKWTDEQIARIVKDLGFQRVNPWQKTIIANEAKKRGIQIPNSEELTKRHARLMLLDFSEENTAVYNAWLKKYHLKDSLGRREEFVQKYGSKLKPPQIKEFGQKKDTKLAPSAVEEKTAEKKSATKVVPNAASKSTVESATENAAKPNSKTKAKKPDEPTAKATKPAAPTREEAVAAMKILGLDAGLPDAQLKAKVREWERHANDERVAKRIAAARTIFADRAAKGAAKLSPEDAMEKALYEAAQRRGIRANFDSPELSRENKDFSLARPVERRKDLLAIHNVRSSALRSILDLDGFAMPSIAVVKDAHGHSGFGDVSVLFGSETIDPRRNRRNAIYSHDAWTPKFPQVEYKVDTDKVYAVNKRLAESVPEAVRKSLGYKPTDYHLTDDEGITEAFNRRSAGEAADVYGSEPIIKAAYLISKGEKVDALEGLYKTEGAIHDRIDLDDPDYRAWVNEQYGDVILERGVYNGKDYITPSGTRRSWEQLHLPLTLDNAVKSMSKTQRAQGGDWGRGAYHETARKYASLKELIKNEDKLRTMSDEEYSALVDGLTERVDAGIIEYMRDAQENNQELSSSEADNIVYDAWQAAQGGFEKFKNGIAVGNYKPREELAKGLFDNLRTMAEMETKFFEAKPQRAVRFDEARAWIVPDALDEADKQLLADMGQKVFTYKKGDEADRLRVVNAAADEAEVRFNSPEYARNSEAEQAWREYDEVVRRFTNKDGTKRRGWMKAPNGKPTNLTERQWVQVRTPSFKRWFGDWEALAANIDQRVGRSVEDAMQVARDAGVLNTPIYNHHLDITATISGASLEKMGSEKATKKSVSPRLHALAIANVDKLFASATLETTHPDIHERAEVEQVRRLGTAMRDPETGKFVPVMLTVVEYKKDDKKLYTVEAVDVGKYKNSAGQLVASAKSERQTPIAEFANSIAHLAENINPESVSKVVDENGEPLPLYHGSNRFGFTQTDAHRPFFLTDSESVAVGYGGAGGGNARALNRVRRVESFADIDPNDTDQMVYAARSILGLDVHEATNAERIAEFDALRREFEAYDERMMNLPVWASDWNAADWNLNNNAATIQMAFQMDESDWDNLRRVASGDEPPGEYTMRWIGRLKHLHDLYADLKENVYPKLLKEGKIDPEAKAFYDAFFRGWQTSDALIDAETRLVPLLNPQNKIANNRGRIIDTEILHEELLRNRNSGIYQMFANTGKKVLEVDAEGAHWTQIPFNGSSASTDTIVRLAREQGYDSVIIRNVLDPGVQNALGNDYIVFSPAQVKSATDNSGAFSAADDDIRFDSPELSVEERAKEIKSYTQRYYSRHRGLQRLEKPTAEDFMDAAEGRWSKFRRAVQDKNLVIREVEERLGVKDKKDSVYYAKDREFGLNEWQLDALNREFIEPIFDKLAATGAEQQDLDLYLMARHAPSRNAVLRERGVENGSGMTDAEAADVLKHFKDIGIADEFDEIAKLVYSMNDQALQRRVDSGRLSADEAAQLRKQFTDYVPLRTDMENDERDAHNTYSSGWHLNEFHMAKGRKTLADSPLSWSIVQAERSIKDANANKVRQVAAELVNKSKKAGHPIGEIIPGRQVNHRWAFQLGQQVLTLEELRDRPDLIFFKEDGKLKAIRMNTGAYGLGNTFAKAVTDKDLVRFNKWFEWVPKITRFFSAMRTQYVPTFILRNLMADHLEVMLNSLTERGIKGGNAFIARLVKCEAQNRKDVAAYFRKGELRGRMKEFVEGGGLTGGGMSAEAFSEVEKRLAATLKDAKGSVVKKAARAIGDSISFLNACAEYNTRVAVFSALREQGVSIEDAVSYARDATVNFNRKGFLTPYINAAYMFSNAAIQGLSRAIKPMREHPKRAAGTVGTLYLLGVIQGLVDFFVGKDDDDKEKDSENENRGLANPLNISEYDKQATIGVPIGKEYRFKLRVRNPFALPVYFGRKTVEGITGQINGAEALADVAGAVGGFVAEPVGGNGFGSVSEALQTLAPTMIDPFVQWATGTDFTGNPRVRKNYSDYKPLAYNGRTSTPAPYKWLAQQLNALSGGNEFRKGAFDTAPENWKLLAETALGGVLTDIVRTVSAVQDGWQAVKEEAPDKVLRDIPFLRDIVTNTPDISSRYYKMYDIYKADKAEYDGLKKNAKKEGNDLLVNAFADKHEWVQNQLLKNLAKRVKELGKEAQEASTDDNGRELAREKKKEQLALMDEFVREMETQRNHEWAKRVYREK